MTQNPVIDPSSQIISGWWPMTGWAYDRVRMRQIMWNDELWLDRSRSDIVLHTSTYTEIQIVEGWYMQSSKVPASLNFILDDKMAHVLFYL